MSTTVKPYQWNKGRPDEKPGVRIRNRDTGGFVFVSLEDLAAVSDSLIDILEQHEAITTVKRDNRVNESFDRLADQ